MNKTEPAPPRATWVLWTAIPGAVLAALLLGWVAYLWLAAHSDARTASNQAKTLADQLKVQEDKQDAVSKTLAIADRRAQTLASEIESFKKELDSWEKKSGALKKDTDRLTQQLAEAELKTGKVARANRRLLDSIADAQAQIADLQNPEKQELARLQGTWIIVDVAYLSAKKEEAKALSARAIVAKDFVKSIRIVGNVVHMRVPSFDLSGREPAEGPVCTLQFKGDLTQKVKGLDLLLLRADEMPRECIYTLEGNKLKMAMRQRKESFEPAARPVSFDAKQLSGETILCLITLERSKKMGAKSPAKGQ